MSNCNIKGFKKLLESIEEDFNNVTNDGLVTDVIDSVYSVLEGAELLRKSESFDANHTIPAAQMKLSGRLRGKVSDHFIVNDSLFTYGKVMSEQEYLDKGEPEDGIPIPNELHEELDFVAKSVVDTIYTLAKMDVKGPYEKIPEGVINRATTLSGKENEAYKLLFEKVEGENNYVINKNALLAVYAGIVEAAQDMQSSMYLDKGDLRELVSEIAPNLNPKKHSRQFSIVSSKLFNGGATATVSGHVIGSSILHKLGLTPSKNSPNTEAIAHLKTGMGNLALMVASKSGLINPIHKYSIELKGKEVELDFYAIDSVPLDTKLNKGMLKTINPSLVGNAELLKRLGVKDISEARLIDLLRLDPTVIDNNLTNPDSEGTIYVTRLITPVAGVADPKRIKAERKLVDQFFDEDTTKAPSTFKPEDRNHKVAKTELTVPNSVQQKRLNEKEQAGFSLNDGAKVLRKMFYRKGKFNKETQVYEKGEWDSEGLLNAIGLKPEEGDQYSATTLASNKASNDSIRAIVDGMVNMYSDGDLGELFFRWFMPINDRTMIRSNVLNPLVDKHLARWLLSNTEDKAPVDVSIISDMINKPIKEVEALLKKLLDNNYDDNYKYIAYLTGMVQAFEGAELEGGKVVSWDKSSVESVIDSFQMVMKSEEKLLSGAVYVPDVGHLGHKLNAIANIGKYKAAVNNDSGEFTSDMLMEGDGVTNGTAFLVYQRPIDGGVDKFKERVGLLPADSKAEHLGDVISKRVDGDTYQMTSSKIKDNIDLIVKGRIDSLAPGADLRGYSNEDKAKVASNAKLAIDSGMFPLDMENVEEAMLNSAWRNISKPGSMTIGYSAEIKTIAHGTTEEITQQVIDNLLAKDENGKYLVSNSDLVRMVRSMDISEGVKESLGDVLKSTEGFRQGLREFSRETSIGEMQFELINDFVGSFTNPALRSAFTSIYESQQELNRAINNSFGAMYELFNKAFDTEVSKLKASNTTITQEDKAKLVLDLIELVPAIGKVDGIKREEKLIFIKKGLDAIDRKRSKSNQLAVSSATTRYNSGDFVGTKAYLNAFITNAMEDKYKSPGAAAAPNSTHMQDNAVISTAIHNVFERTNAMALSIYDASVAGPKTGGVFREYNKVFWEQNLSFNVIEEFVLSIEEAIEGVRSKYPEKGEEWISTSQSAHDRPRKGESPKTLLDYYNIMNGYYTSAVKNRQRMFNEPTKVMQMGGLFAHYTSDPVAKKVELESRLKSALEGLDKVLTKEQKEEAGDRTELTRWARKLGSMKVSQEVLDLAQEVRVTDTGIRTLEGRVLSKKKLDNGKPRYKAPPTVIKSISGVKNEPVVARKKTSEVKDGPAVAQPVTELPEEVDLLTTTIVEKMVQLKDKGLMDQIRKVMKSEMDMSPSDRTRNNTILLKILEGCE